MQMPYQKANESFFLYTLNMHRNRISTSVTKLFRLSTAPTKIFRQENKLSRHTGKTVGYFLQMFSTRKKKRKKSTSKVPRQTTHILY